jgi:hypothetical protein
MCWLASRFARRQATLGAQHLFNVRFKGQVLIRFIKKSCLGQDCELVFWETFEPLLRLRRQFHIELLVFQQSLQLRLELKRKVLSACAKRETEAVPVVAKLNAVAMFGALTPYGVLAPFANIDSCHF